MADKKVTFTLKEEHIKLIGRLNFKVCTDTEYDDSFIPEIDRKRPFGNSGVVYDVLQILGYEPDEEGDYKEEDISMAESLLVELPLALEVVVTNRTFQPGVYEMDRHGAYFQYKLMRNYKALKGALKEAEETIGGAECAHGRLQQLRHICMNISGDDPWEAIQHIGWDKGKDPFWDSALEVFLKHKAMAQKDLCVRCTHNTASSPMDLDCEYACTGVSEIADEGRIVLSCSDYQERE